MASEEEEYEVPSAGRRKEIELSRGVVLMPPERMRKLEEGKKEEEKAEETARKAEPITLVREEKRATASRPTAAGGMGSTSTNILAVIAIIIALAAVGLSFVTLNSYNQMRGELKGIAGDLEGYKEASITIDTQITAEHVVKEDILLKDILSPVSLPVSKVLNVTGELRIYNPATRTYESQSYEGTLTVSGSIDLDPSRIDPNRKMHLNYTIPGEGTLTMTIPAGRLWTPDLDNVLERLKRIAG